MDNQDRHYEELYNRLLDRGELMHRNNKKRIRTGLVILALLPVILIVIRLLTDSDRVVFLIIWVFCTFITAMYLIGIEFIDDQLEKTLEDVTEREAEFDVLFPGTEQLGEKITERRERRQEKREIYRDH